MPEPKLEHDPDRYQHRQLLGPFSPAEIRVLLQVHENTQPLEETDVVHRAMLRFRQRGLIEGWPGQRAVGWRLTAAGEAVVRHWMQPLTIVTRAVVSQSSEGGTE